MASRTHFPAVLLALALAAVAHGAAAQELLSNRHFITDLSGWTGSGWWDSLDVFGDPKTGSATYVNQDTGISERYIVLQCVELPTPGGYYELGGYFYIPAGQSGTGLARLGLSWHSDLSCGTPAYLGGADVGSYAGLGTWYQMHPLTFVAPSTALSAKVYTIHRKGSEDGVFQVSTDELSFVELDGIFNDGFESADTTGWSSTVS